MLKNEKLINAEEAREISNRKESFYATKNKILFEIMHEIKSYAESGNFKVEINLNPFFNL